MCPKRRRLVHTHTWHPGDEQAVSMLSVHTASTCIPLIPIWISLLVALCVDLQTVCCWHHVNMCPRCEELGARLAPLFRTLIVSANKSNKHPM